MLGVTAPESPAQPSSTNRVPHEFAYWKNIHDPAIQRRRRWIRRLTGVDPQLPDDVIRNFAHSYYDADPVAEAFVEEVYMKRGQKFGRDMVDRALAHGVDSVGDAPDSLRRLFAEIEVDPPWLDWNRVERGAKVFRKFGTRMFSMAGSVTLHGYQESSVAKPLAFTGAYTGQSANNRFLETCGFWIDVAEPGAMRPGGEGVKTALRVRLMHVFVRKRLIAHPQWNLEAWGVPISQGDALLTLMGGSAIAGLAMLPLGYITTPREVEDALHFWRYVGYLVGVQPRWFPDSYGQAIGLLFAADVKGVRRSGEDGRNLAHSYVASYAPNAEDEGVSALLKRIEYYNELGYTKFFMPRSSFRGYGLPSPGLWTVAPYLKAPWIFLSEVLRRLVPTVDLWLDDYARWETKSWVAWRLGPRRPEYTAVEKFTR